MRAALKRAAVLTAGTAVLAACSSPADAVVAPSTSSSAASPTTASSTPSASPSSTAARFDPYAGMPDVPAFTVSSSDVAEATEFPLAQRSGLFGVPGGKDASPQLTWSGAPKATKSYVVTVYDADAATGSGLWHWAVKDIPKTVTSLPTGAGAPASKKLPAKAVTLPNDAGVAGFVGAAPPAGDVAHHYYITVYALDIATVEAPKTTTPAFLGFEMGPHVIARASMVPLASTPAQ